MWTAVGESKADERGEKTNAFVPSRDLLSFRHSVGRANLTAETILFGLRRITVAFGIAVGQDDECIDVSLRCKGEACTEATQNEEGGVCVDDADADGFEVDFVRRWIAQVIRLNWYDVSDSIDHVLLSKILTESSRLTAILAGQSASGNVQRTFRFTASDVCVRVNEAAVVQDGLGGRTWSASPLLAAYMLRDDRAVKDSRILELGAGTGLVGLAIAQQHAKRMTKTTEIHLTDYHEDVLRNLTKNVALNDADDIVSVRLLDWRSLPLHGRATADGLNESYTCIVAADCVYEEPHTSLLKRVAERFLAKEGTLYMLVTDRSTHATEIASIHHHFPACYDVQSATGQSSSSACSSARLCITQTRTFAADQQDDFGPPKLHMHDTARPSTILSATIVDTLAANVCPITSHKTCLYTLYTIEWRL